MLKLAPLPTHLLAASLCAVTLAPAGARAISGVCSDGSIYVVQEERQIPCKEHKAVEPHEVPPIRPEYLPTPYTWQVWNEKNNPNNPYNAVDNARQVRGLAAPVPEQAAQTQPQSANGAAPQAVEPGEVGPLPLGLADSELRDLFQIVSLSQNAVPARISRSTADGQGVFEVSFAHSAAFEARVEQDGAQLDGRRVLLFTASSKRPEEFFATFTFVQGHLTFQPEHRDPRQLGVLQGRLGSLAAGEAVLGYVVLPDGFDLSAPMDVYWDDRHTTATFGG